MSSLSLFKQDLSNQDFARQLEAELTGNILPFWMEYLPDRENGGFHGAVTNDLQIRDDVPRAAIMCARILWTFSAAYRRYGAADYLEMATWAYDDLTGVFWDKVHGGVFWSVDRHGVSVKDHKHHYAQAFALYGISEYYRATRQPESLALAQELFRLLEAHAFDPSHGGYIQSSSREWRAPADMRLDKQEINGRKSTNTLLHILEAYTNLLRIWDHPYLKMQHKSLLAVFWRRVFNPTSGHLKQLFDDEWNSLLEIDSYGHDIEASWLLWEAAELQDDPRLRSQIREISLGLAEAVYRDGQDNDGSIFYEGDAHGIVDDCKSWWTQAEAMVGFYNAFQLSGQAHFAAAAQACWHYIQQKVIDCSHSDWFKQLDRAGNPDSKRFKAGPWDCPYHHSRACLEMIGRLLA